jgi:hypothetical protein
MFALYVRADRRVTPGSAWLRQAATICTGTPARSNVVACDPAPIVEGGAMTKYAAPLALSVRFTARPEEALLGSTAVDFMTLLDRKTPAADQTEENCD